jgi:hypothetical protein
MQQTLFAPGACDAILAAIGRVGIETPGDDGCAEPSQTALIAYAKAAGPAGVEAGIRNAAAETLKAMDLAGK